MNRTIKGSLVVLGMFILIGAFLTGCNDTQSGIRVKTSGPVVEATVRYSIDHFNNGQDAMDWERTRDQKYFKKHRLDDEPPIPKIKYRAKFDGWNWVPAERGEDGKFRQVSSTTQVVSEGGEHP